VYKRQHINLYTTDTGFSIKKPQMHIEGVNI
jgi:hypothetical protein